MKPSAAEQQGFLGKDVERFPARNGSILMQPGKLFHRPLHSERRAPLGRLQLAAGTPLLAAAGVERLAQSVRPIETVQYRCGDGGFYHHHYDWPHRDYGGRAAFARRLGRERCYWRGDRQ